jgi:hypothetical protein
MHVSQGGLELVNPGKISNKKYDAELLSKVTKDALTVQDIPEAYQWLEMAVAQSDIPVGVAVESSTAPGALGPLHECGAGHRVAHVQLILPSEHRLDTNQFWALPAAAQPPPSVPLDAHPLPNVRYRNPAAVPPHMLPDSGEDSLDSGEGSLDSDDAPLVPAPRKRQRAAAKKVARAVKARRKAKPKAKQRAKPKSQPKAADPPPPGGFACPQAGTYVLTHDMYPEGPGFSVSQLVGDNQGTEVEGCWGYKHLLSSVDPWKKSILRAKFGVGRGCIVDGGTDLIHSYSIITSWKRGLNTSTRKLPVAIQNIIKQRPDWSVLKD